MSKICSNFVVENEFLACQNRVKNSHKILILNKIIADLQQVTKINSTVGLSGFESWLSNKKKRLSGLFFASIGLSPRFLSQQCLERLISKLIFRVLNSLIRQPFVTGEQVDDSAVAESVLADIMLHDEVVAVRVDADVRVLRETEVHDVVKHMMHVRITADAMDHMIRLRVIQPLAVVYPRVGRFRRRDECEIRDDTSVFLYHMARMPLHIGRNHRFGRIAVDPLVHVAGRPHDLPGCVHHLHDCRHIRRYGMADGPVRQSDDSFSRFVGTVYEQLTVVHAFKHCPIACLRVSVLPA